MSDEPKVLSICSRDEPYASMEGTPPPVPCEFCGKLRYYHGTQLFGRIYWAPRDPEPCGCAGAIAAQERAAAERKAQEDAALRAEKERELRKKIHKLIGESGMGERFLRRTFDTFQITEGNRRSATVAKRYADAFESHLPNPGAPEPGRNGLIISGPPGTGKTHLAAAITNQLIQQGRPVICMTMIDLLERIKRTFSQGDQDEHAALMLYKTVPLLVIDDIGKEPTTEWGISTIYNIINGRYEAYLPVVVTTNYDTDTLVKRMTTRDTRDDTTAFAIMDRLCEMCRSVVLTGESWRQK